MILCNPWQDFGRNEIRTDCIVFANGWSAPSTIAKHFVLPASTDLYVLTNHQEKDWEDYVNLFEMLPQRYVTINLVGFSFGNTVINQLMGDITCTSLVCISGTPDPFASIDLEASQHMANHLDVEMYEGFIKGLSSSRVALASWQDIVREDPWLPTFEENKSSLQALVKLGMEASFVPERNWTGAIIPTHDRIAHTAKQREYWQGKAMIKEVNAPHWCLHLFTAWADMMTPFETNPDV